jgi:predicted dehydrogenase
MQRTRRNFLKQSGLLAGAMIAAPQIVRAETLGLNGATAANSRINLAILATGNRSRGATTPYFRDQRCAVTVLCDPYRERIDGFKQRRCQDFSGLETQDFREALADKDVDAVHISTADHWHVPMSLAAARAGKHIYCEKPLGLSIEQCLAAREITAKHDRIFQYGTQNRSIARVRLGIQLALNGYIGEIKKAYVWAPPGMRGGSATPVLPVPSGFDYDLWLGPAPHQPFSHDRCIHQGAENGIFHIYDYAIGFIAGWGAHPVDQFQWYADHCGMNLPTTVKGTGTIPQEGLFNTITHWDVDARYDCGFEMKFMDEATCHQYMDKGAIPVSKSDHGSMFVGDKGWINVSRGSWDFSSDEIRLRAKDAMKIELNASKSHAGNFIDAIRGEAETVTNLESAIKSDIICHLSDIAIRSGKEVKWDANQETIVGDADQVAMMTRAMRPQYDLNIG